MLPRKPVRRALDDLRRRELRARSGSPGQLAAALSGTRNPGAVIKKFVDDGVDQLGVQVAYWGFFSVLRCCWRSHRSSVSCSRANLFRLLTTAQVTTRHVLPGALLATGCWLGRQALGGVYVTQVLAGSSQTYGGFAAVVSLRSWLLIASELILIAAEFNVVLARRLWPRSLSGELLEADKQALRDSAHAAQLDPRQHIAVRFDQRAGRRAERARSRRGASRRGRLTAAREPGHRHLSESSTPPRNRHERGIERLKRRWAIASLSDAALLPSRSPIRHTQPAQMRLGDASISRVVGRRRYGRCRLRRCSV
jgi:hypothetical protein